MISEDRKKHIWAVAELMKKHAEAQNMKTSDVEALYTLGLLHDIGYEFLEEKDYRQHEKTGGELLKKQGYKYWQDVYYHWMPNSPYRSDFLDLLNWADAHIDSSGNYVSFDDRLKELSIRFNIPIEKLDSYPVINELKQRGFK